MEDIMEKRKYLCLHDIPIFSGINEVSFSSICHATKKQHMKKGELLFNQGDPIDAVYYIKEGSFKLVRITENGEEVIVQIVGSGEVIGVTALFMEGIYSPISAIVMEEGNVCSIDRKSLEKIIIEKPEIALQIIRSLSTRLYDTWERIAELNTQTIQERIIGFFIQLAQEHGEPCPEGTLIKIPLTQQEIAYAVGGSRVIVSQALQKLIKNNYIFRKKKYYILKRKCIY